MTAIGADRPGIIATVAEVLHDQGGNIEDSAMTILGGHFAIMLLVAIDAEGPDLESALAQATADLGLTIAVTEAEHRPVGDEPTHVLSVYGADHPGIVAGITRALADLGVNVTDLNTRLLSPDRDPVYVMILEITVPPDTPVAARLDEVCAELDVDHTLRRLDAPDY